MKKLHLLLLISLLPASVLALSACGGSDGSNDEDAVARTIEIAATSTDPIDCRKYATQNFLEQTQLKEGAGALKECEEDARDHEGNPKSVDVSKVKIDGSDASANASFDGGPYSGQVISLALVEEGGTWKMDEITAFAKFDQALFVKSFEEEVTSGKDALPKSVAACVGRAFLGLSRAELEDTLLSADAQKLVEIAEGCQESETSGEA